MTKKGSYVLLLEVKQSTTIQIGKKGIYRFPSGHYIYVGSAMNGIDQRIHRHMESEKKHHWHIDYLTQHAQVLEAYIKVCPIKEECRIASAFQQHCESIPGFGCSDCQCTSHLFYGTRERLLKIINELHMEKTRSK